MPPTNQRHSRFGRRNREINITFDPGDFKPVTPYSDDLKDEYQEAQQTLLELRQKEELIRRKAEHLEEISHKEEDFAHGRSVLINQIEDYLDLLDEEANESERIGRECVSTHQRFLHHLHTIQSLHPEASDRRNLSQELDRALQYIEAAEEDINEAMPLLNHISKGKSSSTPVRKVVHEEDEAPLPADFSYWLKAGFAFTLPLMMLIVALAIAMFYLN
ncbi:MAG: hypothetical protein P1U89_06830 [Verrucomicrobiales bacterium]|nr:hypothetical protein [Verrucomicrobiales bacterium]